MQISSEMTLPTFLLGTHESAEIVDECRLLEEAGFDGVVFPEHHGVPGWSSNPLLVAYKVGMATSRLRVGSAPIILPLYEPVRLAETAAFIQNEIGHRLILGVGGGYMPGDFSHFGARLNERGSRQNEGIEIVRLAWSGEPFQYEGRHYQIASNGCLPVASVPPPIWVCSGAEAGVRRAARYGDALVLDGMRTRNETRQFISMYEDELAATGRTRDVVLIKRVWVGDPDYALSLMNSAIGKYSDEIVAGSDAPWLNPNSSNDPKAASRDRVFAGNIEFVAAALSEWINDLKPDRVVLKLPFISEQPGPGVMMDQIRKLGATLSSLRRT